MIGIIVALSEELSTLTSKKIARGEIISIHHNILVIRSGIGRENAIQAAHLLQAKGAKYLISWGCAGALAPNLKAGDLLFPEKIQLVTGEMIQVSQQWLFYINQNLPIIHRSVSLLEHLTLVTTQIDKQRLFQRTQASAIDMESGAIVQMAQKWDVPCLVIRTIADPANLTLPSVISLSLNKDGEVILTKLLIAVLKHPLQLFSLIKLGLNFSAAKKKLQAVAQHLDIIASFDVHTTL